MVVGNFLGAGHRGSGFVAAGPQGLAVCEAGGRPTTGRLWVQAAASHLMAAAFVVARQLVLPLAWLGVTCLAPCPLARLPLTRCCTHLAPSCR